MDTIQMAFTFDEFKKKAQSSGNFTVCAFLFSPDGTYDKYASFEFNLSNTSFEDAFKDCGTQLGLFYKYKGKTADIGDTTEEKGDEEPV